MEEGRGVVAAGAGEIAVGAQAVAVTGRNVMVVAIAGALALEILAIIVIVTVVLAVAIAALWVRTAVTVRRCDWYNLQLPLPPRIRYARPRPQQYKNEENNRQRDAAGRDLPRGAGLHG